MIIINGPPGVGKTAICRRLLKKLEFAVWLDGDWCWMMDPFVITRENKEMAEDNIMHLLRNFLSNENFQNVIFDWVMHKEGIGKRILKGLGDLDFQLYKFTLICSREALEKRMSEAGRSVGQISRAMGYLPFYRGHDTVKVDTTGRNIADTVEYLLRKINND